MMRCIIVTIIATFVAMILLGQILSKLGVGPYWAQYHSASGVEYACMYQTKEDFVTATLDGVHYHEQD